MFKLIAVLLIISTCFAQQPIMNTDIGSDVDVGDADRDPELLDLVNDPTETENRIKNSQEFLQSHHQRHSPCMAEVVAEIRGTCDSVTEEERSWMALRMLGCHLSQSGLGDPDFSRTRGNLHKQLRDLDPNHFQIYTQFLIASTTICQRYRNAKSDKMMNEHVVNFFGASVDLLTATNRIEEKMEKLLEIQHNNYKDVIFMFDQMKDQARNQMEVWKQVGELGNGQMKDVLDGMSSFKNEFNTLHHVLHDQTERIMDVTSQVQQAHESVVGTYRDLVQGGLGMSQYILYGVISIALIWITSFRSLMSSRTWIFVLVIVSFGVEWMVSRLVVNGSLDIPMLEAKLWSARKLFSSFVLLLLAMSWMNWSDPEQERNDIISGMLENQQQIIAQLDDFDKRGLMD